MKKNIIISILVILIVLLGQGVVRAASPSVTVTGESKSKAGETGTVTINVTSGTAKAGVVSGKIETDAKISSINVVGKNNWNLTYNDATGEFNVVKAAGADSDTEGFMTISYTIKSGETGTATIKMSNLKVTSIDYQTEMVSNVTKSITIEAEQQKEEQQGGELQQPGNSQTVEKETTKSNSNGESLSTNKMPKTGENSYIILAIGSVLIVIGIVSYIKYKRSY